MTTALFLSVFGFAVWFAWCASIWRRRAIGWEANCRRSLEIIERLRAQLAKRDDDAVERAKQSLYSPEAVARREIAGRN